DRPRVPRGYRKGTSRWERRHEWATPEGADRGGPVTLAGKQAVMAGRILNRRELGRHADQAERSEAAAPGAPPAPAGAAAKAKGPVAHKVKKARAKKPPPRLRARWGVFDSAMKQVAVFDYNQRAAAEEKCEELTTKKNGTHFLQIVKEPMPESGAAEAPVS